jgi:adenosylcobyric acid synthase
VVVVADVDRGGALAAMYGTLALLEPADQRLIAGFVVNKFRGDLEVLQPGLDRICELTARPIYGVLPWLDDVWIDSEDTLAVGGWRDASSRLGTALTVAVVRFPRISNATDVDALACEPGVDVVLTADPGVVVAADLAVLPGSRATVSDLAWLRERGIAAAITSRAESDRPVLGICGGYQMLAERIVDPVESGRTVDGLGLLPTRVGFDASKHLGTPRGTWQGHDVIGYEIHHGVASVLNGAEPEPFLDGWRVGAVWGTTWHGAFDNDAFRRAWLTEVAAVSRSSWTPSAGPGFAEQRERMLDRLADAIEEHLDTAALADLIEHGIRADVRLTARQPE